MIIRNYEKEGLYGAVYATTKVGILIKFLKEKGFKLTKVRNKKHNEEVYVKEKSKVLIFKNKEYYIIEVYSDTEERVLNQIKVAGKLDLLYSNISLLSSLEYDGYLNTDLFGDSIMSSSELFYTKILDVVKVEILKYNYLRHKNPNDIVIDLLMKWEENQNFFAGNNKMLSTFIKLSVVNFLNTLHLKEKYSSKKQVSIECPLTDNLVLGDTLHSANNIEDELIKRDIIDGMNGIAKEIVSLLDQGYKIYEITEKMNLRETVIYQEIDKAVKEYRNANIN